MARTYQGEHHCRGVGHWQAQRRSEGAYYRGCNAALQREERGDEEKKEMEEEWRMSTNEGEIGESTGGGIVQELIEHLYILSKEEEGEKMRKRTKER